MMTQQTARPRMIRRASVPEPVTPRRFDIARVDRRRVYYDLAAVESWIRARIRGQEWQPTEHDDPHPTLISRQEMLRRIGNISYVTIWKLERKGQFPAAVKIAPRAPVE